MLYLSAHELIPLLADAYFVVPVTETTIDYVYYRGRYEVEVTTLRYNLRPNFSYAVMRNHLYARLCSLFPNNRRKIMGAIAYDLLLVDDDTPPASYYIWKANSNQRNFDESKEYSFYVNQNEFHRFFSLIENQQMGDLNMEFRSSKVRIDRALTIVLSFMVL